MLETLLNTLQTLVNGIWGFIENSIQFFRIAFKIVNHFIGSQSFLGDLLPAGLSIVCTVSLGIFVYKAILGGSSG